MKKASNRGRKPLEKFQIESGIELPTKQDKTGIVLLKKKIDNTIKDLKPLQSFVILRGQSATVKKHLVQTYPEKVFRLTKIKDNPKNTRIFRIK